MASKHPYISSVSALNQALDYLRKSFPATFNSETVKKLSIAPGNESYVINIMRFLSLIDDNDARTETAHKTFTLHNDTQFQAAFSDMVETAYSDLFALHADAAWSLSDDKLVPYFRQTDKTTQLVGARQANTFKALSAYSGHTVPDAVSKPIKSPKNNAAKKPHRNAGVDKVVKPEIIPERHPAGSSKGSSNFGLTVRIEINLPATGDQDTYDKIFKSVRENFINE